MSRRLSLALHHPQDVEGTALEFTDVIRHAGEAPVARFRALVGDRRRQVELTPGGQFLAGQAVVEVVHFESREAPALVSVEPWPERPALEVPFGEPFVATMGQWCRLPGGQRLQLTGLGRFGAEYVLDVPQGGTGYRWCDYGFWREDGLFVRTLALEPATHSARVMVDPEVDVSLARTAVFGAPAELGPADVLHYPGGVTLRLREGERRSWGAVSWSCYAQLGDDVNYPALTVGPGRPASDTFALQGRRFTLTAASMRLEPSPTLEVSLVAEPMARFALDGDLELRVGVPLEGPGGLVLEFTGCGHGHGFRGGPDGQEVPVMDAWGSFDVTRGGVRDGFRVETLEDSPVETHERFGLRFTVLEVDDDRARVRVRKA